MRFPLIATQRLPSILIIRIMVGAVFLSEGLQKFLLPATRGAGRFEQIGFAAPGLWANLVGGLEVVAGLLILLGLLTRYAAIITAAIMAGAIVITKIPIALGEPFAGFNLREMDQYGFWSMAHAMRTDFAMLLGSIFLLWKGGGWPSVDRIWYKRRLKQKYRNA